MGESASDPSHKPLGECNQFFTAPASIEDFTHQDKQRNCEQWKGIEGRGGPLCQKHECDVSLPE